MKKLKSKMIVNYCLNKFCPTLVIGALVFINLGLTAIEPYAIMGMLLFSQSFHYRAGYAMAYCESNGIKVD